MIYDQLSIFIVASNFSHMVNFSHSAKQPLCGNNWEKGMKICFGKADHQVNDSRKS